MRNHEVVLGGSMPKGVELENPEMHLSVDALLERTGDSSIRLVRVHSTGDVSADPDAVEQLRPYVETVREASSVLGSIVNAAKEVKAAEVKSEADKSKGAKGEQAPPKQFESLHFPPEDGDGQRHAVHAARLLSSSGVPVRVTHEVSPGRGDSKTIWTRDPVAFSNAFELVRGVEARIGPRLNGFVPDEQRGRLAAGLMEIAVRTASAPKRG